MNDDLISRQAAIKNLAGIAKNCARSDPQMALMGRCIYMIENMSSVQPEPEEAEWEERTVEDENPYFRRRFYCTGCGEYTTYGKTKFCPECGRRMKGDV